MNWRGQESRREGEEWEKNIGVGRRVDDRKRKEKKEEEEDISWQRVWGGRRGRVCMRNKGVEWLWEMSEGRRKGQWKRKG